MDIGKLIENGIKNIKEHCAKAGIPKEKMDIAIDDFVKIMNMKKDKDENENP